MGQDCQRKDHTRTKVAMLLVTACMSSGAGSLSGVVSSVRQPCALGDLQQCISPAVTTVECQDMWVGHKRYLGVARQGNGHVTWCLLASGI